MVHIGNTEQALQGADTASPTPEVHCRGQTPPRLPWSRPGSRSSIQQSGGESAEWLGLRNTASHRRQTSVFIGRFIPTRPRVWGP